MHGWLAPRSGAAGVSDDTVARGAAAVLFVGEGTAVLAVAAGAVPFLLVVAAHVLTLSTLLALTWTWRWRHIAQLALVPAAAALVVQAGQAGELATRWPQVLALSSAIYAVFIAYPVVLGQEVARRQGPVRCGRARECAALLCREGCARRRRLLDGRRVAGARRGRHGAAAAATPQHRAAGRPRPGPARARRWRRARVRHGGDPAATPPSVDHDWLGARGRPRSPGSTRACGIAGSSARPPRSSAPSSCAWP